jgi:hypothetical protein
MLYGAAGSQQEDLMRRTARWLSAGVLALGLLEPAVAAACSVCGCGDPLLIANDPAAVNGRLRLQLDVGNLTMRAANDNQAAVTDELRQTTAKLDAVYSPTPGLSFIATLPFTRKQLATGGTTTSDLSGLGDVELGSRWELFDVPNFAAQRRQTLALAVGSSTPTGTNDATNDGERVDEHGQLGTGGWGPYLGLHYRFEQERWTVFASATERVRTANAFEYRYGPAILWSLHGQLFASPKLAVDFGLDGRYASADRNRGETQINTGGAVLALAPGLYWNVVDDLWLSGRGQFAVYERLRGRQTVGPVVSVGLQYLLF